MVENSLPQCVFCERSSNEVPLVALDYQGNQYHICSEHIPVLIHSPHKLQGMLPGAEKLTPHGS